jgi:hypothetical protein
VGQKIQQIWAAMLSKIARKKTRPRPVATSRAASLKGWRTRQKMQQARLSDQAVFPVEDNTVIADINKWPAWMKRALPNPWI